MDIFSHGLWAVTGAKIANRKVKRPLRVVWAAWWGVFPDVFAFVPIFTFFLFSRIFGGAAVVFPSPQNIEPVPAGEHAIMNATGTLYSVSHSLIIFVVIYGVVYLIRRKHTLELGGWLLHILMDIPTHSYRFYPTPFLWPVSGFKFDGFSWANPWFLVGDYLALTIAFLLLRRKK
jgi:hypothetical protein